MSYQNHIDLLNRYTDRDFRDSFSDLYSLSTFFGLSIVKPDYRPPDCIADAIALSEDGKLWEKTLLERFPNLSAAEARLAPLIVFYHQEPFVDVKHTSIDSISAILHSEILGERIMYPWVYEHLLYDRYYESWPDHLTELTYEETERLLSGTPNGVFQMRSRLVGPFGLLQSEAIRSLPPTRKLPLWHCSDPACNALHTVRLVSGKCNTTQAVTCIYEELNKSEAQSSEWNEFYGEFDGSSGWYDDFHLDKLPWLLANAFSLRELKILLISILKEHSAQVRARFPIGKRFEALLRGSAADIAGRLDKAQCLQLLLLLSNNAIVKHLEALIETGAIVIPTSEVRDPVVSPRPRGWFGLKCECSRLGVRSMSARSEVPLARLKDLIRWTYTSPENLSQLEWMLRHVHGESIQEKIDRHIQIEEPHRIVMDLILSHPRFLTKAQDYLKYGNWPESPDPAGEQFLVSKILWKLGFAVPYFPPFVKTFWDRLEKLLCASRTFAQYTEEDREAIRSAAVNFFVSLEDILDISLSFVTWALLSDHYGKTRFRYNQDAARQFMISQLDGKQRGGGSPIHYDPAGRNTLFPLIQGFSLLADLCDGFVDSHDETIHRNENDMPGYVEKTSVDLFCFKHRVLVLDLREPDRHRFIRLLRDVTAEMENPDVCDIRNRLEHKRKDFPSQEDIDNVCSSISKVVNKMETAGAVPLIYSLSKAGSDWLGRGVLDMRDYRNRIVQVYQPSQYVLSKLPKLRTPNLVLMPWLHVGESLDIIRFKCVETSDFTDIWSDYPKRRSRIPITSRSQEEKEQPTNA